MQYKIPVQIENEDPIVLGLSLRQLIIIIIGSAIGYSIFTSLQPTLGTQVAAIPGILCAGFALLIAVFKSSQMTFVVFVLNFIRLKTNETERVWVKGVDSIQPIDVGFVSNEGEHENEKIDFSDKIDKIKALDEQLNKI